MLLARLGDARVSGDLVEDLLRRHQLPEESSLKKGTGSLSVPDPWHFGLDPDPDPRIHASD